MPALKVDFRKSLYRMSLLLYMRFSREKEKEREPRGRRRTDSKVKNKQLGKLTARKPSQIVQAFRITANTSCLSYYQLEMPPR